MTPAGIEPTTFRFVAQHLNHCATTKLYSHSTVFRKKIVASQWLFIVTKIDTVSLQLPLLRITGSKPCKWDLMNRITSFLWKKLSVVLLALLLNVNPYHQNKPEVNWWITTNQMLLIILLYFLQVQHVSGTTMPIIRSSRKDRSCYSLQPGHYSSLTASSFQPT